MKEQYERALKALADKMEMLRDEPERMNRFHACTSMIHVAEAMEKIGRIIIALEYCERMDSAAEDTVEMMFDNMMRIRKDAT